MNNLKKLRKDKGVSQQEVANAINVSRPTYAQYESEVRGMNTVVLTKLSEYFGVSTDEILGINKEVPGQRIDLHDPRFAPKILTAAPYPDPDRETARIPILGSVRAGYDNFIDENVEGWINVDPRLVTVHAQAYALRVKGDSMEPEIHHGDFVICLPDAEIHNDDIAIVCLNGDIGTVKRIAIDKNGLSLIPSNKKYPTSFFTPEEVQSFPVTILAKVDEIRRKL